MRMAKKKEKQLRKCLLLPMKNINFFISKAKPHFTLFKGFLRRPSPLKHENFCTAKHAVNKRGYIKTK